MGNEDTYLKILEKISEVREDVGVLKNETQHLKMDMSEVRKEVSNIKDQDVQTRKEEKELRDRQIKEIDGRLKKAEAIPNSIQSMKKFIQWFSVVLTGLVALAEYLRHS